MKQELGFIKDIFRDNKMAEWVKVLAAKLSEPSCTPGTHTVE